MAKESTRFKFGAREIWIVVIVVYLLVAIPAVVFVPVWIVDLGIPHAARIATDLCFADPTAAECANAVPATETMVAVSSARQSALLAAGGGLAVITIVLTILRDGITRAQAAHDRETHITSMYVDALAQIGDKDQVAIRIGGIYALRQIAEDSARHGDAVMAVLATFLRVQGVKGSTNVDDDKLDGDVDAAFNTLGHLRERLSSQTKLRLMLMRLPGVDADGLSFKSSDFGAMHARDSTMTNCDFEGSDFSQAEFWNCDLSGTSFINACLLQSDLSGATLAGVDFTGADFTGVRLFHTDLRGVIGLTREQINTAECWSKFTLWPTDLRPQEESRNAHLKPGYRITIHELDQQIADMKQRSSDKSIPRRSKNTDPEI